MKRWIAITVFGVMGLTKGFAADSKFSEIVGVYQGSVSKQSSDGLIDELLVKHATIRLAVVDQVLTVKTDADLAGRGCRSKVGAIRQFMTFPRENPRKLKAEFDFDPGKCFSEMKPNVLVVTSEKTKQGGIILQTLMMKAADDNLQNRPLSKINYHGFFDKDPR